jgi:hypothetical protein
VKSGTTDFGTGTLGGGTNGAVPGGKSAPGRSKSKPPPAKVSGLRLLKQQARLAQLEEGGPKEVGVEMVSKGVDGKIQTSVIATMDTSPVGPLSLPSLLESNTFANSRQDAGAFSPMV